MNLGKSVLFATAAGFISMSGAQAADLLARAIRQVSAEVNAQAAE